MYTIFRDNKYEDLFPGITDPSKEKELKDVFYWAHIAGLTRFVQKEFSFGMGKFPVVFKIDI